MTDATSRLLSLLSLLQTPREWSGTELADRLGVSARTVRRDIDRLRELDYPVQATMGAHGGYRLAAGAAMPPLLLDDEETVSTAVGLRTVAAHTLTGVDEAAVRALAKLEQVMPARLRARMRALGSATETLPAVAGPAVDTSVLTVLAAAITNSEQVRFDYRSADGAQSTRLVEPYRLVVDGHRWYLVSFDRDRQDWRLFRVDRLHRPQPVGLRITPRELPAPDAATYVHRTLRALAPVYRADVTVFAPASHLAGVADRLGAVEPIDEHSCRLRSSADTIEWLAFRLTLLDCDFHIHKPPELVDYLHTLANRLLRAATCL